jgi:hypothetical protein
MAKTYEPIATTTVSGTSTTSITFSSIPSTYTDLLLAINSYWNDQDTAHLRFNGDSGANYSATLLITTQTPSASSDRTSGANQMFLGRFGTNTSNSPFTNSPLSFGTSLINIQNYSNTTTFKTVLARLSNYSRPSYGLGATAGLWRSTSAINSITIFTDNTSYAMAGSTFTLYGIKAA